MRNYEFRVWNGSEMIYEPQLSLISTASVNDFFKEESNVIMQKTDLPFDIWQNDILQSKRHPNVKYIVVWNKKASCYSALLKFEYETFKEDDYRFTYKENIKRHWIENYELKPIGNIFENPELF